jgi:hypothetical protein
MKWILILCWIEAGSDEQKCSHVPMPTATSCVLEMNRVNHEQENVAVLCRAMRLPEPEDA